MNDEAKMPRPSGRGVVTTEILIVANDAPTPLDLLLFRRFRQDLPGLVERTLLLNPGLADLGPLLPRGARVLVEPPAPVSAKPVRTSIRLYD
jgi:phage tail protein X